jgi:hypothetical protein
MKCRFGTERHTDTAVAVYILDHGCFCFPDDKIQALCAQHEHKSTPIGNMVLVTRFDGERGKEQQAMRPISTTPAEVQKLAELVGERNNSGRFSAEGGKENRPDARGMKFVPWEGQEISDDVIAEARLICKEYCYAVVCDDGCKDTWPGCSGQLHHNFEEATEKLRARNDAK